MKKRCKFYDSCGFEAEKEQFPTYVSNKNGKTYYRNMCAPCFKHWNNGRSKQNYLKNRDAVLARQKFLFDNNPEKKERKKQYLIRYRRDNLEKVKQSQRNSYRKPIGRFKKSMKHAKERGIDWNLSFKDFINISNQPCYYCSNKFCKPVEVGSGLDRLDNSRGYESSNVVPCGKNCNTLRSNLLSPEETKIAIDAVLAFRNSHH